MFVTYDTCLPSSSNALKGEMGAQRVTNFKSEYQYIETSHFTLHDCTYISMHLTNGTKVQMLIIRYLKRQSKSIQEMSHGRAHQYCQHMITTDCETDL